MMHLHFFSIGFLSYACSGCAQVTNHYVYSFVLVNGLHMSSVGGIANMLSVE